MNSAQVEVPFIKICMLLPNLDSHPISRAARGKKLIKFYSTSFPNKWLISIRLLFCVSQNKITC